MNPPPDASGMAGDARALPVAEGADHPFGSEGLGWAGLGPVRASRDDVEPGTAMNPPPDASGMSGDARTLPTAEGADHPFGSEGLGWAGLGPVRASRDDVDPGTAMSPPPDASRMAGDARALPAAEGADHPFGSEGLGWAGLGPVRASRDEVDPGLRSPVGYDDDEPFVPVAPGEWRLAPIHAAKDDDDPDAPGPGSDRSGHSSPAHTTPPGETSGNAGVSTPDLQPGVRGADATARDGTAWSSPLRIGAGGEDDSRIEGDATAAFGGPLRIDAGGEGERAPATPSIEPGPESAGDDPVRLVHRPASPEPARIAVADADPREPRSFRPSPERVDVPEPRSTTHRAFDPRGLPRRHGAGRAVGVALSLLAAVGAGAAGGYHLWKTELVRPALVRDLPPMPAPIADLAPVPAAHAATDEAAGPATGPATGTPLRPNGHPPVPASEPAEPVEWPPASLATGRSGPEIPPRPERTEPLAPAGEPDARTAAGSPVGAVGSPAAGSPTAGGPTAAITRDAAIRPSLPTEAAGGPAAATEGAGAEPGPDAGPVIEIRKGVRDDRVAASLERAYEAFRAGDLESAAEAYRAVAGHEPGNRDALLGLAAVATRAGRRGEAAGHYARVLASHPADTVARAALIAIEEPDPVRGESRLKALLWSEPEAAHLHFDLGNVYAAQSRWAEAQQSYFDACRFDRGNADYAYNLAVSLDHLSRRESALGFYREALALARSRPASFETAAVLARIRELDPSSGEGAALAHPLSEPAGAAPAAGGR